MEILSSGNVRHTMLMANSIIGASILSMPFCFKQVVFELLASLLVTV